MLLFVASLWFSVSALLLALFGVLHGHRFRSSRHQNFVDQSSKSHPFDFGDSKNDIFKENESSKLVFKFQYQTQSYEDFTGLPEEAVEDVSLDSVPSTTTNKYEFNSGDGFSCFVERPEEVAFKILESFSDPNNPCPREKQVGWFEEGVTSRSSTEIAVSDNAGEEAEAEPKNNLSSEQETCHRFRFLPEGDFFVLVSDFESLPSSYERRRRFTSSAGGGFSSDTDFEEVTEQEADIEWEKQKLIENDLDFSQQIRAYHSNKKSDTADNESRAKGSDSVQQESNASDSHGSKARQDHTKNSGSYDSSASDTEDLTRLETLWEHQELIEQLKGELKKVRGTGLPTILEESEYPKIMEDLKPWKMDEKCHHEGRMSELHKLHKSYRERMRKLDVLSYQKLYPIGTVLSREALRFIASNKASSPPATASLSQNFRQTKRKISEADAMVRYVRDLQSGLEVVYVGQLCLSWEILHWQYEKALEIWESDPYQTRRYNEVAGEFQQFQVLLQRFMENEPFQGPRAQSYANNRHCGRNLLQVPLIREDSLKDKSKGRRTARDGNAITSDMLVEIMEESIRIFWRFVRADKAANIANHKSRKGSQIQTLDPADAELLAEVHKSLQKKDKRLKEVSRGTNCILKKMKINDDESSDQVPYFFFSQVDVKLVARVLGMSKVTRDQLLWCHSKLNKIKFVNRKIHVEPTFLLFPY